MFISTKNQTFGTMLVLQDFLFSSWLNWAKWGRGRNETLVKEGKSPIEIWEVHSTDILENHKHLKQFHENILTEYEKSKEQGQTMQFWEQYWKDTYSTNLPNPFDNISFLEYIQSDFFQDRRCSQYLHFLPVTVFRPYWYTVTGTSVTDLLNWC
jgi:hypothetical protein